MAGFPDVRSDLVIAAVVYCLCGALEALYGAGLDTGVGVGQGHGSG